MLRQNLAFAGYIVWLLAVPFVTQRNFGTLASSFKAVLAFLLASWFERTVDGEGDGDGNVSVEMEMVDAPLCRRMPNRMPKVL